MEENLGDLENRLCCVDISLWALQDDWLIYGMSGVSGKTSDFSGIFEIQILADQSLDM